MSSPSSLSALVPAPENEPIDLICPAEGTTLAVYRRGVDQNADQQMADAACLIVRAQTLDEYSACLHLAFWEAGQRERGEDPTLRVEFGIPPQVEVPVPFDFHWLDGQTLFAPRTLGRLKMVLFGKALRRSDIEEITLATAPSFDGRRIRLWPCKFAPSMPEITLPRQPLIDELGQWIPTDWPGKTKDRATCSANLRAMLRESADYGQLGEQPDNVSDGHLCDQPIEQSGSCTSNQPAKPTNNGRASTDRFGGWIGKTFAATGWFRVARDSEAIDSTNHHNVSQSAIDRFWLVDPDGHAFISAGVDCVGAGIEIRVDPVLPWLDEHVKALTDQALTAANDPRNQVTCEPHTDSRTNLAAESRNPAQNSAHKPAQDPDFHWSADPNGCGGINATYDYAIANLRAAFGDDWRNAWSTITINHLHSWGINTIGNWSDLDFARTSGIPYVIPADTLTSVGFPATDTMLFRDFPDVFSSQYTEQSQTYAQGLLPWRDERNLIGYFMRNEPNWAFVYNLNIAEEMLANPADLTSKHAFVAWLRDRYHNDAQAWRDAWAISSSTASWRNGERNDAHNSGEHNSERDDESISNIHDFNDLIARPRFRLLSTLPAATADLKAFSRILIDRYVRVPAEALRRVDPHHLNLGMRYAYITDTDLLAGSDCYDVFSINSYQRTAYDQVEALGRTLNMPVMVGEFHHGATDRGLTAHGIRGVTSQAERGVAYRYYMEQAARSPYFVGAHYFQYNDQSCLGRFDGENYQIGLVDVCTREYPEMAQAMRQCTAVIHEVAAGIAPAFDRLPAEVNPIHY
ncbi:hypothetical protein [Bifidobacterium oedipodis]|uniref:Beta-agarase n=1 Tax=Bifidobacterium oedipodis TaxID=2675322 RepID=A0A7Y0EPD0_9BIFI|nr:hypothetical protein [Bifidobacterium sp. DSM 109957]NMM93972.1 hypothetical protein [Bifidobacterium sp. DSM 109957]